jgi:class 3 adenylate cyclase
MRFPIGLKIFGIALGLLILMAAAALLSMRMTRTVDDQLAIIDQNYFPAYVALAQANIRSVEESAYVRRLLLTIAEGGDNHEKLDELRQRVVSTATASDERIADARQYINRQIADPLDFDDNIALARLDDKIEALQEKRQRYEAILGKLLTAAESGDKPLTSQLLGELDEWRDDFDRKIDAARSEMRRLASAAIVGTRAYQRRVVAIGVALLAIAALLGITVAAAVTFGLVRPVRRLLLGTAAVEGGALDTVIPITSRDEIGRLTQSFNSMVGELRLKAQIRDTFGKYVDPRIVAGLIDRPELTDAKGSRREMTILFCDMKEFTAFSEGMTPAGLVNVLNRYMTVMSEPVRHNNGIIDKYIGDGIMAFWGPPFTSSEEHPGLACLAALDQLAGLAAFRAELPELTGFRRGYPEIDARIGIATGDVVVGNIGSELTRTYTVIGDTVNLASRLEGANKTYGTRVLISEETNRFAADMWRPARSTRCWWWARPSRNVSSNCSAAKVRSPKSVSTCAMPLTKRSPPIAARSGRRPARLSRTASRSCRATDPAKSFWGGSRISVATHPPQIGMVSGHWWKSNRWFKLLPSWPASFLSSWQPF